MKMNYNETCFYGIDFKKIKLYCKVKYIASIKTKEIYRTTLNQLLIIDPNKYYDVYKIDFEKEILTIYCFCKKSDKDVSVILSFNQVEFSYFFENTKEIELNELSI